MFRSEDTAAPRRVIPAPDRSTPFIQKLRQRLEEERRRQRNLVAGKLAQGDELLPLLMKRRNGGSLTRQERQFLIAKLRRLSNVSPYLKAVRLPGGGVLVPLYAWWLDQRTARRG